jgi:phosphoheptose isomerase
VLGRPFRDVAGERKKLDRKVEEARKELWEFGFDTPWNKRDIANMMARVPRIGPPGARALGQAAANAGGRVGEMTAKQAREFARRNRATLNEEQKAMRDLSMKRMELEQKAADGDKQAEKDLDRVKKEETKLKEKNAKAFAKAQDFQSEFLSPLELMRKIQIGALSTKADPAQETADNTKKIADLLTTKLKDGNKILAVADGPED